MVSSEEIKAVLKEFNKPKPGKPIFVDVEMMAREIVMLRHMIASIPERRNIESSE